MESENIIEVENLAIGYSDENILEGVSFSIKRGEITVILGTSGCGKSTLLKALIGLLKPRSGIIRIMGEEISRSGYSGSLRRRVGVLFQSSGLLGSFNIFDNVAFPLMESEKLPQDWVRDMVNLKLSMVNLASHGEKMPSELSGGMKKRAALARAMILDPELLFCDEPAAGLDPITAAGLDKLFLELRDLLNITLVVVTHELLSIEKIADKCIMIDKEAKGIVAQGTLHEIKAMDNKLVSAFFQRKNLQ